MLELHFMYKTFEIINQSTKLSLIFINFLFVKNIRIVPVAPSLKMFCTLLQIPFRETVHF